MYKYILLPGRHHAITQFQIDYLQSAIKEKNTKLLNGKHVELDSNAEVVWAVTSANHANTRRNPISGARRLGLIEHVTSINDLSSLIFLIQNMDIKPDFAHYIVEEIKLQSNGLIELNPQNCLVACSTPDVIAQYESLGFEVLPMELKDGNLDTTIARRPWELIETIVAKGDTWSADLKLQIEFANGCLEYYQKYSIAQTIYDVFEDPLQEASTDGDLTDTRDYEVYRQAFEDNAFRKVDQFSEFVEPGRILDIGSATGQTIKLLTERSSLAESDFYGVEAARPLYAICQQRKENGAFGNANVFFYQRNIMQSTFFPDNSLNTIITMALTHEIESYLGRQALLEFITRIYKMLAPNGVYINYDVAAPNEKDTEVFVKFNDFDGVNPSEEEITKQLSESELAAFLESLSTKARFIRFAHDFRGAEKDTMSYTRKSISSENYFVMRYGDLCDFLAKKDYVENWHSEMHERFCYWEYSDWTEALAKVGFVVEPVSKAVTNEWLIENRFAPAAKVYKKNSEGQLEEMPQPATNIMLVARKPA